MQQFNKTARKAQLEIQMALPLPEVMALISQGLMNLALFAFGKLAEEMMSWKVAELVGQKYQAQQERVYMRWGSQSGYCVVNGQKVPWQRPRVRDTRQREVPLGSHETLQRASLMEEAVWNKIADLDVGQPNRQTAT